MTDMWILNAQARLQQSQYDANIWAAQNPDTAAILGTLVLIGVGVWIWCSMDQASRRVCKVLGVGLALLVLQADHKLFQAVLDVAGATLLIAAGCAGLCILAASPGPVWRFVKSRFA